MTRTPEQTMSGAPSVYADAAIQRIAAANGIEYAYRDVGEGEGPLVLLQHFRGNLDNWDPALIDALASSRRVVTFDNTGVGATTGTTPDTIEQMARDAIAFVEAMGFKRIDLLGFSIGSFVAQEIAVIRTAGRPRHARLGAGRDRCRGPAGDESPGIRRRLLRPLGHQSRSGATGRRANLREDNRTGRTDDVADPPGAV